jgi:hypothetical protein
MSMSPFVVGMKVVCVSDEDWNATSGEIDVIKGNIYIIRSFHGLTGRGHTGILVEVIHNIPQRYTLRSGAVVFGEAGYNRKRFRPVKTVETDISIFTAMLNPANHREAVS